MEIKATGNHEQDSSDLEAHLTRINELVGNLIKQEIHLKKELESKKEDIALFTASLENSNIELDKLQSQMAEMREINDNNQAMIAGLRNLVTEQELQLKNLKEVIDTKEQVITSFAISLENSKKEIVELHKQLDEMKAINENKESMIREYKEKIDLLSKLESELTNRKSEPKVNEDITIQKAKRKSQKKKLKRLLKENPKANEKELAEILEVDSSYISKLRKEIDI